MLLLILRDRFGLNKNLNMLYYKRKILCNVKLIRVNGPIGEQDNKKGCTYRVTYDIIVKGVREFLGFKSFKRHY